MARATYQPLADAGVQPLADSAVTLASFCGPRAPGGNTKTDQTRGRSVALLAPLHPKCPFQVVLLRVRLAIAS